MKFNIGDKVIVTTKNDPLANKIGMVVKSDLPPKVLGKLITVKFPHSKNPFLMSKKELEKID